MNENVNKTHAKTNPAGRQGAEREGRQADIEKRIPTDRVQTVPRSVFSLRGVEHVAATGRPRSLDPGPGCNLGGIMGWRSKAGRLGLGIKKMTKEEADKWPLDLATT